MDDTAKGNKFRIEREITNGIIELTQALTFAGQSMREGKMGSGDLKAVANFLARAAKTIGCSADEIKAIEDSMPGTK